MKKKKIKLEDLKIQSFSTSHRLSKKDTDEIIGGTAHAGCRSWWTECFCNPNTANPDPYGNCGGTGSAQSCPNCASDNCPPPTNTCNHTDPYICDTHPEYC